MTVHAETLLSIVLLLPLLGALVNGVLGSKLSQAVVNWIGVGSVVSAFMISVRLFYALKGMAQGNEIEPVITTSLYTWLATGMFHFEVAFYLDPLSAVLLLIVTGVGAIIHIYSMGYMRDDSSYARYFSYLNLFTFSILVLVLGKNLFLMFLGWEGVGLCSYLLLGFWFTDAHRTKHAHKAFIFNRVGDLAFIVGMIVLLFYTEGTTDFEVLGWTCSKGGNGPFYDPGTLMACCLLLFLGACFKSAQIPFQIWLPDSAAAPMPITALIHSLSVVAAGIYMIARLSFLFTLSPLAMTVIAVFGAATALLAGIIAVHQRNFQAVLSYATVSQLGLMTLAAGVGAYVASIFHLLTHALFSALLFLVAGCVIRAMSGAQDITKMGGLKQVLPTTRWTFLVATLAISGIPLLSGFFSLDGILWETQTRMQQINVPNQTFSAWTDGNSVVLGGEKGTVLTSDDGRHWDREQLPPTAVTIRQVRRSGHPTILGIGDDQSGSLWAVAQHCTIYRKGSGPFASWEHMFQPTKADEERGFTTDIREAGLKAVWSPDASHSWFVGQRGTIVHFNGTTFDYVDTGSKATLHAIVGLAYDDIYAAGAGGVILRYDGTQWTREVGTGSSTITALKVSGKTVYGTTEAGALLKRGVNGWEKVVAGEHWPKVVEGRPITSVVRLNDLAVKPDGSLVVAGSVVARGENEVRPALLVQNGESSWSMSAGEPGAAVRAVSVLNAGMVAVGAGRKIYTESDGALMGQTQLPHRPTVHQYLFILALISTFLTAFYMTRLYLLTFEGQFRGDTSVWEGIKAPPESMTIPLVVLASLSLLAGYIGTPLFGETTDLLKDWLASSFSVANTRTTAAVHSSSAWASTIALAAVASIGAALAWLFFRRSNHSFLIGLDKLSWLQQPFRNGLYLNRFYSWLVERPFTASGRFFSRVVDEALIDGLIFNRPTKLVSKLGSFMGLSHSGAVYYYLLAVVVGLTAVLWVVGN